MQIRAINREDNPQIRQLYEEYYKQDFNFPDFYNNYLSAFTITNDMGRIIIVGGVRAIGETILMTDKWFNRMTIGRALVEAQNISLYTCEKFGIEYLHAFVKDENYAKHLIQHGFSPRCMALSMKVK